MVGLADCRTHPNEYCLPGQFWKVFNTGNCGRRRSLSGAAVLFLVLNTFSLLAGQSFFFQTSPPRNRRRTHRMETRPPGCRQLRMVFLSTNVSPAAITNNMGCLLDDKHTLAIGDRISFRIEEDEEDPKSLTITDSGGTWKFPTWGGSRGEPDLQAVGPGTQNRPWKRRYYYQATVIIAVDSMARSRGKVYLVGPVRMPGPQELPRDEVLTLSKAILRAGASTDFADKHNVKNHAPRGRWRKRQGDLGRGCGPDF